MRCQLGSTQKVAKLIFKPIKHHNFIIVNNISRVEKEMSGKPSDEQLRQAIDAIFSKYDTDKSGTLEDNEINNLINDAFKSLGRNREVTQQEVKQFITAIDKNGDGKIAKPELFEILKQLINSN